MRRPRNDHVSHDYSDRLSFDPTPGERPGTAPDLDASRLRLEPGNERWRDAILEGARRSGLPASTIAAIIDAETGRAGDKGWTQTSRNVASSAHGLGQFTRTAWIDVAQHKGSYLHDLASGNGWLAADGKVFPWRHAALLALRNDGETSIITAAEFAAYGLHELQRRGLVPQLLDNTQRARYAYLAYHEGMEGAVQMLTGTLGRARARRLYAGNFPGNRDGEFHALAKIERAENRHRGASLAWESFYAERLKRYTEDHVQPARFLAPAPQLAGRLVETLAR
jgi:hypothetical protein